MITNDRQYRITKSWIKKFEDGLFDLKQLPKDPTRTWVRAGQEESLAMQIEELQEQVKEYEKLRAGKLKLPSLEQIDQIPELLIKWRIARGLTQKNLAQKLGVAEQQIQKYEQTGYAAASLDSIKRIAELLRDDRRSALTSKSATAVRPTKATRLKRGQSPA